MSRQADSDSYDTGDTLEIDDPDMRAAAHVPLSAPVSAVWGAGSQPGRGRLTNQDRWVVVQDRLFAVADGMGGHDGGEVAASAAADWLEAAWPYLGLTGAIDWFGVFAEMNHVVRTELRSVGVTRGGTTLTLAVLAGRTVTTAHVGDSLILLNSGDMSRRMTQDHLHRSDDRDRAVVGASGGLVQFLGMDPERLAPDVRSAIVRPGDRMILCSDGVHRIVDLADAATGSGTAEETAKLLLETAEAKGGRDDATVIVVDLI